MKVAAIGRVRLVHGDADAADRRKALQHRVGDRAGGGLDQPVAPRAKRLARDFDQLLVGHRVLELVAARGLGEIDVEQEIEPESLADLGLVRHDAVIGVQHKPLTKIASLIARA